MKKTIIFILCILLIIVSMFILFKKEIKFYLENKYYGKNDIQEIDVKELDNLITKKESFSLLIYQPLCITSTSFEEIVDNFQKENSIMFYKIPFSSIKEIDYLTSIKHYPSFIIFKKGNVAAYLDAESDEHIESYKSVEGFKKWFTKYVKLRKVTSNDKKSTVIEKNVTNIKLEDVKKEKNKVNIYLFWQVGCHHCAKELDFIKNINEEDKKLFNLYTFDVSASQENLDVLKTFSSAMNEEINSVPYTIIGKKSFHGFNDKISLEIIDAIKEEYKNNYDIYFDNILEEK